MPPKKPAATKPKAAAAKPKAAAAKPAATKAATKAESQPAAENKETKAESSSAKPVKMTPQEMSLKQIPAMLIQDQGGKIKDSGRWPLVMDPTNNCTTFLRYQNCNVLNALSKQDMTTHAVRMGLLGAIRYGKPFIYDMVGADLSKQLSDIMEEILPGLMKMVMDKTILEEENYTKLINPVDGDEYDVHKFSPDFIENFKFIIVTNSLEPSEELMRSMYPIIIQ